MRNRCQWRGVKGFAMFGYLTLSPEGLTQEQQERYQSYYCGLCRVLGQKFGPAGRVILSNDMTFLCILLSSLYEPQETAGEGRCLPHPLRRRAFVHNSFTHYCADMSIALAYHKCLDDWKDEHSLAGRTEAGLLRKAYEQVRAQYPEICEAVESSLEQIALLERQGLSSPDEPAALTARMLGRVFRYRPDYWGDTLRFMGEALGRFIYLMDAYDDLASDLKRNRYNPLRDIARQEDYEALCGEGLSLLIGECAQAFELLPLVKDVDILRNILYSGVWARYQAKQRAKGAKPAQNESGRPAQKEDRG